MAVKKAVRLVEAQRKRHVVEGPRCARVDNNQVRWLSGYHLLITHHDDDYDTPTHLFTFTPNQPQVYHEVAGRMAARKVRIAEEVELTDGGGAASAGARAKGGARKGTCAWMRVEMMHGTGSPQTKPC